MDAPAPEEAAGLDALVRRVDPDRWLSSRLIADPAARADAIAIYAFDHELARAPRAASNSLLGEIRLTWWREVLDEAFAGGDVRRHPTVQALADTVRRRRLPRAPLEAMIDARYRELDEAPMSPDERRDWAEGAAGEAAGLVLRILTGSDAGLAAARAGGRAWMLARATPKPDTVRPLVELALAEVRAIPPEAFPAIAHAALARPYLAGRRPSAFGKRLRMLAATVSGRP